MARPTEVLDLTQEDEEDEDDIVEISLDTWGARQQPIQTARSQQPPASASVPQPASKSERESQAKQAKQLPPYSYKPRYPIPASQSSLTSSVSRPTSSKIHPSLPTITPPSQRNAVASIPSAMATDTSKVQTSEQKRREHQAREFQFRVQTQQEVNQARRTQAQQQGPARARSWLQAAPSVASNAPGPPITLSIDHERTIFYRQLKRMNGGQLPANGEEQFYRWRAETIGAASRDAHKHVAPLQSARRLAASAIEEQGKKDEDDESSDSVTETPKLSNWGARKSRGPILSLEDDVKAISRPTTCPLTRTGSMDASTQTVLAAAEQPRASATTAHPTIWPGSMGAARTSVEAEILAHMRPVAGRSQRIISSLVKRRTPVPNPALRRASLQSGAPPHITSRESANASATASSASITRSEKSGRFVKASQADNAQTSSHIRAIPQTNQGIKRTVDGKPKVPSAAQELQFTQTKQAQPFSLSQIVMNPGVSPALHTTRPMSYPQSNTPQSQYSQSSYFPQSQGSGSRYYDRQAHAAASRLSQVGASVVDDEIDELIVAHEEPQLSLVPKSGVHDAIKDARIAEVLEKFKSGGDIWRSSVEEDDLVDYLKDYIGLTWNQLEKYFPHRSSWNPLQNRYSVRTRLRKGIVPGSARKNKRLSSVHDRDDSFSNLQAASHTGYQADVSMAEDSDTGPLVQRRSKRAAVEAASKKGYLVNMNSFKMQLDGDELMLDANHRPLSAMGPQAELTHPVTHLKPNPSIDDHARRHLEKLRDLAAMSGMVTKLNRPPRTERQKFPLRLLVHKRSSVDFIKPYRAYNDRKEFDSVAWEADRNWHGKILHVDFTDEEVKIIEPCISRVMLGSLPQPDRPLREYVVELMVGADQSQIRQIARNVQSSGKFINRTLDSIQSYLSDLSSLSTNIRPIVKQISLKRVPDNTSISVALHQREGLQVRRQKHSQPHGALKQTLLQSLGPSHVFKKASSDVTNVCWSSDGVHFAAGATALMDASSMQYNRRNNLLIGSFGQLQELPNHAVKRTATETGANATHAMLESQDPLLYTTISAVKFSPDGKTLLTAGYDKFARVWNVDVNDNGLPLLRYELRHKAPVDLLEVNENGRLIATGAKQAVKCVKVLRYATDLQPHEFSVASFSSPKAADAAKYDLTPSVIRWGPTAMSQDRYLVAGFSSTSKDFGGQGETCIWDLQAQVSLIAQRGGRCVFDIAWSPSTFGRLAIACTPHNHVNRGVQSIVRIFDSFRLNSGADLKVGSQTAFELDSPALDVNDVIFNSGDSNLITTGCTDGKVYVWDLRNPDHLLHSFAHGRTLVELDLNQPAEALDTGIRFVSWDESRRKLFSGSSDGVVALWDPYVAAEDAHVRNVIQLGSGVMSGAFSPDFSNLLLGEEDGTITMLAVGHEDQTLASCPRFDYHEADKQTFEKIYDARDITVDSEQQDAGITAAQEKLDREELKWAPLSGFPRGQVVQGPNYEGPYDNSFDALALRRESAAFQRKMRPQAECHIQHSLPLLTEEEMGDSFAWRARIPAAVRWPQTTGNSTTSTALTQTKSAEIICFRCHLHMLQHDATNDILSCHDCREAWRSDVLGYTPVDYYTNEPLPQLSEDALDEMAADMSLLAVEDDPDSLQNAQSWVNDKWSTDITL
jgi:WD40 repeat protein